MEPDTGALPTAPAARLDTPCAINSRGADQGTLLSLSNPDAIPTILRKFTPLKMAAVMKSLTMEPSKHRSAMGTSSRAFTSINSTGILIIPFKNDNPESDPTDGISPTTPPS